jgi:signal transduction histidine kinase
MLLDMARTKIATDPEGAGHLLDEAHAGTKTAIRDLRQLGRGIHPAILTDSGLDAALSALVARSPLPTTLDVRLDSRCNPDAEAAVYFAASEALANAAKHAGATACSVRVARREDAGVAWLVAEITDNGRGGARVVPQGGLAGLSDRLGALGGRLDLRSGAATGTTLSAVVPCA